MESSERGRVYACSLCNFKGEKRAAVKHFESKHFESGDCLYQCRLCAFGCNDHQKFKRHVSFFGFHAQRKAVEMAKGTFLGNDESYQIVNANPRVVNVDTELTKWDVTQSANYWQSRRKVPAVLPESATNIISAVSSVVSTTGTLLPPLLNTVLSMAATTISPPVSTTMSNTYTSATMPSTFSPLPSTLDELSALPPPTSVCDTRIVMTDTPPTPSPLKLPPATVPRPEHPAIPIPPPSENILPQLLNELDTIDFTLTDDTPDISSYPTPSLQSAFESLTSAVKEQTDILRAIQKELVKNRDQMEKMEIAVRRSYTHTATPRYQPNHRYNRKPSKERQPLKRRFVPEMTVSPEKRIKSTVWKSSPKKQRK